jgi:MoaA/NifB/PqqE/SkfB family radical SAM enzyme
MLTGFHLLLTYRCTHECEHCFLFCGPRARGTFTMELLRTVFDEAEKIGTIDTIFFEGGEPFLYHALLVAGVKEAGARGFRTGIVTNAYWAESEEDALLTLRPLAYAGLGSLAVSADRLHYAEQDDRLAENATAAAGALGIDCGTICLPLPEDAEGVRFRGRAADALTGGIAAQNAEGSRECPDEDLADPGRVHLDAYGNVHLCQGILMGNFLEKPLSEVVRNYRVEDHPICGPLHRGGPAELANALGVEPEAPPVSACHLCFQARRQARERFPEVLGPEGVYGGAW